jgi:Flp pilus assembly pilin Flp
MLMSFWHSMRRGAGKLLRNEEGAGVVEVIMIIAVVIIVAIIFRDQLIEFVTDLLDRAEEETDEMFDYNYSRR